MMSAPPPSPPIFPSQQQPHPILVQSMVPDLHSTNVVPQYPINPALKPPRVHSCVLCQQRKVKCDRQSPCSNCKKARVECISSVSIRPRRRKRRFPEAELLAKVKKYGDMLKELGVNLDEDGNEEVGGNGIEEGEARDDESCGGYIKTERSSRARTSDNGAWAAMSDEFRNIEEALQGSSEDETETPITRTYDTMYTADGSELILGFSSQSNIDLAQLHPNPVQIFQLWQIFLENIHPLLKLFHAPTVQQQIFQIAASPDMIGISKEMEALMFGIYSFAVLTMDDNSCLTIFGAHPGEPGTQKRDILARFHSGARIALVRAQFMRCPDMTVLQGFLLYLLSVRQILDPRSLFCLTGLAVRIAQRLGLHRDGPPPGISMEVFQTEMRRRLWWQIILFDSRVAELSGAGTSSLTNTWNTKLPLNINDADLYPSMREAPTEHQGVTEMLFVLLRCEITDFIRRQRAQHQSPSTSKSRERLILDLEDHLQKKYLSYCDPAIPLHFLSSLTARTLISKMKLHLQSTHLLSLSLSTRSKLTQTEKDRPFSTALSILSNLSSLFHNQHCLHKWKWYVVMHIPLDAYIFVLSDLRHRTTGELADSAWSVLEIILRTKDLSKRKEDTGKEDDSTDVVQARLASLAVKAWEARERVASESGGVLPTPVFISRLREEVRGRKSRGGSGMPVSPDGSVGSGHGGVVTPVPGFGMGMVGDGFGMGQMGGMFQLEEYGGQMGVDWNYWGDAMPEYF